MAEAKRKTNHNRKNYNYENIYLDIRGYFCRVSLSRNKIIAHALGKKILSPKNNIFNWPTNIKGLIIPFNAIRI